MKKQFQSRQYTIIGIIILFALVYIIWLFNIQVVDVRYKLSADNNVFRQMTQYPARGLIFDRNGKLLVYNEASYDLMLVPKMTRPFDTADLCRILEVPVEFIRTEMDKAAKYSKYKPSAIYRQMTPKRYALLQEKMYKFYGFFVQTRTTRRYPLPLAAHILGYVGEVNDKIINSNPYYKSGDYIGVSGIEKSYEPYLRGKKGLKIYVVDVHNNIQGNYKDGKYDTIAVVGDNLQTTIDVNLQEYGEKLMQNKIGSIVAIEPSTGEILALISAPGYDPNLLIGSAERAKNYSLLLLDDKKPLFNRALMAYYPPGSTFKLVNALIGMQEGLITEKSVLPCNGGFNIGTHIVKCHHGGSVGFTQSIQGSCNSYYCSVFSKILTDRKFKDITEAYTNWRNHLVSFGLGEKMSTDLAQELPGIVRTSKHYDKYYGKGKWKSYTLISMGIGQGELGFTPLQIANMTSTIANRGWYITPHIVKKISGYDTIFKKFSEKKYTRIKPEYFEPLIEAMRLVVESGTAKNIYYEPLVVCGKTGTAQNPHGEDHSIFSCFSPQNNPKIVVTVYVENGGFGSEWAAPIASLIIEKYLTGTVKRPELEKKMMDGNLLELAKMPKKKKKTPVNE